MREWFRVWNRYGLSWYSLVTDFKAQVKEQSRLTKKEEKQEKSEVERNVNPTPPSAPPTVHCSPEPIS